MINLSNVTFIIPVSIESKDRERNLISVLGYLNSNFKTNIIIHEIYKDESKIEFISSFENLKIKHIEEKNSSNEYHRTRQINEALSQVKTKVVCNYDADVILPIKSYVVSEYLIQEGLFDVVYPYGFGKFQMQIDRLFDRREFNQTFDLGFIGEEYLRNERSEYGHCIFYNTDMYKSMGGENENFIAYGPEDTERYIRSFNFGFKINRVKDYVYHFEHERTSSSSEDNLNYEKNLELFNTLKVKSPEEFLEYYKNQDYVKKYNFNVKLKNKIENNLNLNSLHGEDTEVKKNQETIDPFKFIQSVVPPNQNMCACGEPINKVKYNFCPKCNRMYK